MSAHSKYDIDIVNEGILALCEDYRDRLHYHGTYNDVNVYALDSLDVALIKLGRGSDKDIDDIKLLLSSGNLDYTAFCDKYPEFRRGYMGNNLIIDTNFYEITGIDYRGSDKRMF